MSSSSSSVPWDAAPEPEAKAASASIGRYRLCFELAAGGMATVYLARAEGPHGYEKLVALKRIHPHLAADPSFVEMFLDEARIASRIVHPNVCATFDFGEADGAYYIAMEYLVGESLSRVLAALGGRSEEERPPRIRATLLRAFADACEGLHAAHELRGSSGALLGVVHRDVSPQNLFITYDGGVRIVDFGIATAEGRVHRTETGQVKGKYAYMAPEQVRGRKVDRRADVWSLGVVMWECLTLRRLFRRATGPETILSVASDAIVAPSTIEPSIPPSLDAIVLRALERDPELRWPTARALGRALLQELADEGVSAGPADLAETMEQLFPNGRERRERVVELASAVLPVGPADRTEEASPPPIHEERTRTLAAPPPAPSTRRRIAGAIAVGVLVAASLAWLAGGTAPTVEEPSVADEPAAPPAAGAASDEERVVPVVIADPPPSDVPVPPPPPPPPPRPRGEVSIVTDGYWAEVRLGGRVIGETPMSIRLPEGRHTLELRPFGREPSRRVVVSVRAGARTRVVVPAQ